MRGGFTKGMIVGSIIGISMSMMMDTGDMSKRKRRMLKNGRSVFRSSSDLINDVARMFR